MLWVWRRGRRTRAYANDGIARREPRQRIGLSSVYSAPPSSYADRAEMVALCNLLKRAMPACRTRDEGHKSSEAVEASTLRTCSVHVESSISMLGARQLGQGGTDLAMIQRAQQEGSRGRLRRLPYAAEAIAQNLLPQ
jgi:hypothetical protein